MASTSFDRIKHPQDQSRALATFQAPAWKSAEAEPPVEYFRLADRLPQWENPEAESPRCQEIRTRAEYRSSAAETKEHRQGQEARRAWRERQPKSGQFQAALLQTQAPKARRGPGGPWGGGFPRAF